MCSRSMMDCKLCKDDRDHQSAKIVRNHRKKRRLEKRRYFPGKQENVRQEKTGHEHGIPLAS